MHDFLNQGRKENNKVVVFILFLIKWFSSAKNPHQPAGNRAMQWGAWMCLISQGAPVKSPCSRMTAAQTCSGERPAAFHPQHRDAASCPFPQPPTANPWAASSALSLSTLPSQVPALCCLARQCWVTGEALTAQEKVKLGAPSARTISACPQHMALPVT